MAAPAVFVCLYLAALVGAGPALAGTTNASTLTKTGTDTNTGATASSAGTTGKTAPGDTIKWVLTDTNTTGSSANANITDPIGANQTFVHGSLQSAALNPAWSTNGGGTYQSSEPASGVNMIRAAGTIPATSISSSPFSASTVTFNTPGGDGYSIEGLGNNVYTVFHHSGPNNGNATTVVYCATLTGGVCPGWPATSTYVNPTAGTPLGTGGPGPYTTAGENGSFIANGNLYWPVENTVTVGGVYPVGLQCLNLTTRQSCGFTQLATVTIAPLGGIAAMMSGDGIPAANGNYYFFDANGDMLCFNATSGGCGSTNISGGQIAGNATGYLGSILTSGQYIFQTYIGSSGSLFMSCYDTASASTCAGFPKNEGVPVSNNPDYIAPVLSPSGALLGVCDVNKANCYSPTGAAIANPYAAYTAFADLTPGPGFGSGGIVGSRFYTSYPTNLADPNTTTVLCFDFSAWSGSGAVPQCSGFSGQVDAQNYTVRALANLPGCMAADGNLGQIIIFNAQTGGSCSTDTTQVALTPHTSYCDGAAHATPTWGTLRFNGLNGSEYAAATVTLVGAGGVVPGYSNLRLAPGQTSLDLSSLPVSGNTTSLTAQVTLTAVSGQPAVSASTVTLSWSGAPVQVCFNTVVGPAKCSVDQSITNQANAVTVGGNGVSDSPGGNNSGDVTFFLPADPTLRGCEADLSITKTADGTSASPGKPVMYTLLVQNHGPETATGAAISDAIPAGLSVVSAQPSQGSCTVGGAVDCSLGTILSGGSVQILVTANVASSASGPVQNCATTSAFQSDPNSANNSSCVTIQVTPPTPPTQPTDVQVVKHVNHGVATFGQVLTYTLVVKNNGPGTAPNVGITDTSTVAMRVLSIKPSQGTCSTGVPFSCKLGSLASGKTAKIVIRAWPRQSGTEINSVSTTAGCTSSGNCPTDRNVKNNVSHARTTVVPHLALVKTVNHHSVNAGQLVTYHLKVSDPTPVALKNVRVCDQLPLGIVYVRSSPRATTSNGMQCWSYTILGAHKSTTITLVARALAGSSGLLINHATATARGVPTARAQQSVRVIPGPKPPTPVTG